MEYNFKQIEQSAQNRWKKEQAFRVKQTGKNKFYCLEMYPYPSGSSLHMGHLRNYTIGDILARYRRMKGDDVLYPMGFDAFGLPAENAAKTQGIHPAEYTKTSIDIITKQFNQAGISYDWSRSLASCDIDYYKWNQWFFLKLIKEGIAYRKKAPVNWCDKCNSVLANEQVEQGMCWRHEDTPVQIKHLEQWFLKITQYAQRLLDDLEHLDEWPENIKSMQRNWIGKSTGTTVHFQIENTDQTIPIFTTRVDTIYGVTFMVFAPEHPTVSELVRDTPQEQEVTQFVNTIMREDRTMREVTQKKGMFIGKYAIHPLTKQRIPIYIGNFVLMEYGGGCVMAVPAHDQRDYEFAKIHKIPIKRVITSDTMPSNQAYTGNGILVDSGEFSGMENTQAITAIQQHLESNSIGQKTTAFKLRDWLISRQRYWGTPIPVVYCDKCGMVPLQESDLPVILPNDIDLQHPGNPLCTSSSFATTPCPKCKGKARRETDTMDGFIDSCWYYLAYTTPDRSKQPFDKQVVDYWMPVDQYIGGAEHAVMHLLYARFFTKLLYDWGMVSCKEPFKRLLNQGIVYKDGAKMSKSKGNIVTQESIANTYGIDSARFFLMSIASPEKTIEWDDNGINGAFRSIKRIFALTQQSTKPHTPLMDSRMHSTIHQVSNHIDQFMYNLALVEIMKLVKYAEKECSTQCLETICKLIQPFCPHLAQGMWEQMGNSSLIALEPWPVYDPSRVNPVLEYEQEFIDQVLSDIERLKTKIGSSQVTLLLAPAWTYTFMEHIKQQLKHTYNPGEIIKNLLGHPQLKEHATQISKLVPQLLKNQTRIPLHIIPRQREKELLQSIATVTEHSDHPKAQQAMPGKPAIILS